MVRVSGTSDEPTKKGTESMATYVCTETTLRLFATTSDGGYNLERVVVSENASAWPVGDKSTIASTGTTVDKDIKDHSVVTPLYRKIVAPIKLLNLCVEDENASSCEGKRPRRDAALAKDLKDVHKKVRSSAKNGDTSSARGLPHSSLDTPGEFQKIRYTPVSPT